MLQPERLEEVLASVLDRRQERTERGREHIAELHKRAAETDLRLKRLYDAIETGVADLDDPALKERIAGLTAIRDQAQADAHRAHAMAESVGQQAITRRERDYSALRASPLRGRPAGVTTIGVFLASHHPGST